MPKEPHCSHFSRCNRNHNGRYADSVKYFNPEIKNAYKEIEANAGDRLVSMLPDDFKDDMDKIIKMNGAGDDELKNM